MADIGLEQARQLIDAVFDEAARRALPALSVAVLDSGAHLKALQRQDGVSFLRADICQAKAWGALAMATNSRALAERLDQDHQQRGFVQALNAMTAGRIVALPGGVLIRSAGGEVIGALGVAGAASDEDEACALAAIARVGLLSCDSG